MSASAGTEAAISQGFGGRSPNMGWSMGARAKESAAPPQRPTRTAVTGPLARWAMMAGSLPPRRRRMATSRRRVASSREMTP